MQKHYYLYNTLIIPPPIDKKSSIFIKKSKVDLSHYNKDEISALSSLKPRFFSELVSKALG